jgi:hypothetical protein
MNSQNKMMGDESYAFGCLWARRGIFTVNDLWDSQRHTWRRTVDLAHQLGQKLSPERYEEMLLSIPSTWCIRGNPAFQQFEWVASLHEGKVDQIFQLTSPWHGTAFKETQPILFIPGDLEEVDISGMDLKRIRVVSTTGDLKSSKLNPKEETLSPVWLIGITQKLQFDPGEWSWVSNESELPFFNYMAKVGYHAGLDGKCQESRLQIKLRELKYTDNEIQAAIALIWDSNKPAKLQYFAWQVASGGLFTGSRARHLGFPGDCIQCNSGLLETTEHCLNFCSFARKAWKWASTFREAFGLHKDAPWKEKMTGIQPHTDNGNGYTPHHNPPMVVWDVLRVALSWRIWCAHCRIVFKHEPFTVQQACQLAWMNTVHAGMARVRHLKRSYALYNDKNQKSINQEFVDTWCRNSVFCSGSLSAPKWSLSPSLSSCLPALRVTSGPL